MDTDTLSTLNDYLDEISRHDADSLTQRTDFGPVGFSPIRPLLLNTIDLAKEFRTLPLEILPLSQLEASVGSARDLAGSLNRIVGLSLVSITQILRERPTVEIHTICDELMQEVSRNCESFCSHVYPLFGFLKVKSLDIQSSIERSNNLVGQIEVQFSEEMLKAKNINKEIQSILRSTREAAGKTAVNIHAVNFEKIADKHRRASWAWLAVTVVLTMTVAYAAWFFMFNYLPDGTLGSAATVQRIVSKLVFISTLYFGIVVAARNYRTHRHLAVINEHRQTSLLTFETFVNATVDEQTKNAVLIESTRCIFSPLSTGYLGHDDDNPNRIIEILKMVGSNAPK